jgi:hypothetical protein
VLFGGCQDALEPDDKQVADQVGVDVLVPAIPGRRPGPPIAISACKINNILILAYTRRV